MLQDMWRQASELIAQYVPNTLGALAILVFGWLAALLLAAVVRGALKRTTLDNRLAKWLMRDDAEKPLQIERYAGKAVFYLAMIFVLVAFFQALNLTIITEPLNALLTRLTEYAPRLLGAGVLILAAWVVATVLRAVISGALRATNLDKKITEQSGVTGEAQVPISKTIADAVYWLTYLLFLPAILGALALDGLLAPVQGLTDQLLGFLPNLFGAVVILAVGWFVARLVQRILVNLLDAAGLQGLSDRVGLTTVLGEKKLSSLIGLLVYVIILIPVLIASLNALQLDAITAPASDMLGQMLDAVPSLFAAVLLLTLAYFIGRLVSSLAASLLEAAGFNNIMQRLGLVKAGQAVKRTPSELAGTLVMIAIMLFAAIEAAGFLGFDAVADLIAGFIVFGGQVLLGLVIVAIGLYLANIAADAIAAGGTKQHKMLSLAARVAIVALAVAMALREMGLANEIISLAFGLVVGSIAVAAALAFGLGSRDVAGEQVRQWLRAWTGAGD